MVDLWYRCTENLGIKSSWVNQDHKPCVVSSSLTYKGRFKRVDNEIREYFDMGHAEPFPTTNMEKAVEHVCDLLIHAVYKQLSSTTRV